jgi:hypothetical protein
MTLHSCPAIRTSGRHQARPDGPWRWSGCPRPVRSAHAARLLSRDRPRPPIAPIGLLHLFLY